MFFLSYKYIYIYAYKWRYNWSHRYPTSPVAERGERQTFAPKVAGSNPTGAHCERRGEKSLPGFFFAAQRRAGMWESCFMHVYMVLYLVVTGGPAWPAFEVRLR